MATEQNAHDVDVRSERWEIVAQLEDWLEMPMLVLSIIWLGLFVIAFVIGVLAAVFSTSLLRA